MVRRQIAAEVGTIIPSVRIHDEIGLPAIWIPDAMRAEALGYTVVDAESVVVTHLTETIRRHVAELLTRQDTRALRALLRPHDKGSGSARRICPTGAGADHRGAVP